MRNSCLVSMCKPLIWCFVLLCSVTSFANAQEHIYLETGKSISLPLADQIDTVFIADTSVADANLSPNNNVFVFGKTVGETTLIATSLTDGRETTYNVTVIHNVSEIRSSLSSRFPGESISIESSRGSILVRGTVTEDETRSAIITTLQGIAPGTSIIDQIAVSGSNLIRLQVRLLEVNRQQAENFGIDWNATVVENGFFLGTSNRGVLQLGRSQNTSVSLNASIDVLVSNRIATLNQETILSTVSGDSARFAVGGEIPVPGLISDSDGAEQGNFRLDYKFVGTELIFTPTRAPGQKMRLAIDSTVSSQQTTVSTVNGNTFPNLNTRAFRTNVELVDGQSFVIAGLSRQDNAANLRQSNGRNLSSVVDAVFGADRVTDSSQELVVVVTPFLGDDDQEPPIISRLPPVQTNLSHILRGGADGIGKSSGTLARAYKPAGFKY